MREVATADTLADLDAGEREEPSWKELRAAVR